MNNLPDEKIVELVLSGKKDYFCYIVNEYKNQAFSLVVKLVGNIPEKEDIAQEIFIKIYQKLNTFDCKVSKFSTWFYTIANNHCIDYMRKKKPVYHPQEISELNIETTKSDHQPEKAYIEKEGRQNINMALGKLELKYRMPIVYRYVHKLSYEEIAEIMHLPLGTVKTYIYRAKEKLLGHISLN